VILRSECLARKMPQEWLKPGWGRAIEGVLTQSDQTRKTWL
jgi:hypothetical protein